MCSHFHTCANVDRRRRLSSILLSKSVKRTKILFQQHGNIFIFSTFYEQHKSSMSGANFKQNKTHRGMKHFLKFIA